MVRFSLIICTYKRPRAVLRLLQSVREQELYPDEILVIDGSQDQETRQIFQKEKFPSLKYYQVKDEDRGLTRQRNFGISKVSKSTEVICFLDDDVVLTSSYFRELLGTYKLKSDAVGVGGYIIEPVEWQRNSTPGYDEFEMEGYKRKLGTRNTLRKVLGLLSNRPPGVMPTFSHGFSTGFLPPTGKIYPVEFFMGGVSSFKKHLFQDVKFSEFFEGYGLYEDMDFCLRCSKLGQLYVNTAAQLHHYHEVSGRPNQFRYGKMVIRNGWHVWRIKNPNPTKGQILKWHLISFLLALVRLSNFMTTKNRKEAITDASGRIVAWWLLLFDKPYPK